MPQEKFTSMATYQDVGQLYDRLTVQPSVMWCRNLHFGYWDIPASEAERQDEITKLRKAAAVLATDSKVTSKKQLLSLLGLDEAADRLTDVMTEKLKLEAGSRVLDVGCGVGGPGVRIAQRTGARVTGISVSHEQLALANAYAESVELAQQVTFQWANAMELPFPAESFDAAIALESIIHMPDRGQVLRQIFRVLRPGGRLVLTDFFERATIPPAKQPVVNRFLDQFVMTMVQAEHYPPLIRQAGLLFEEILDVSAQTLPRYFSLMSTRIGQAQPNEQSDLPDMIDILTEMIEITEFGYLMVTAKRPAGICA